MNTEELRETFKDILNRTDCTEEHVTTFVNMGLGRVERVLKLDLQKTSKTFKGQSSFSLPNDFLSLILVKLNGNTCQRVPDTYDAKPFVKEPVYRITEGILEFPSRAIGPDDNVLVRYFKRSPDVEAHANLHADLIIYAALIYAADLFVDERKASFENTYGQLLAEVQMHNDLNQMSGLDMRVVNPYEGYV